MLTLEDRESIDKGFLWPEKQVLCNQQILCGDNWEHLKYVLFTINEPSPGYSWLNYYYYFFLIKLVLFKMSVLNGCEGPIGTSDTNG